MVAILIFTGALVVFYVYSINLTDIEDQKLENLIRSAEIVSDNLLTPGIPFNWTIQNVSLIGISDNQKRLNTEKVIQLDSLALNNYSLSQRLLSTRNHYYIFFEDRNSNRVRIDNIDYLGRDYTLDDPENIIKVYRFVLYNSTILRMGVYTW